MAENTNISNNPLLKGSGLPPFTEIKPEQVEPAFNILLKDLDTQLTSLETNILEANIQPTWEVLVEPLEEITEGLTWSWGVVSHLMGVQNSPELRQAYEAVQPHVIQFSNRLS
ncbi:MAG: M3 family peptidase, partial [Cyanobacteria bacterium J06639_18]